MGDRTDLTRQFGRPTLDVRVLAAAAQRDWVLTTEELFALGLTQRQIVHRVRTGRLHRRHRGVYAVGRDQLSFDGACRAAVAACGTGSAISHDSALRLRGLGGGHGAIHVSVPRARRGQPGLRIHRPSSLPPDEIDEVRGIAVTTLGRTLLDVAVGASVERVAWLMHEAGVQRVLDLREVWAVLGRHPGHRGRGALEAALAIEVAPTRSGLERAYLDLCRAAGVPAPHVNHHVWSVDRLEEVDFHWPEKRVVVEVDGTRYHSSRWRRRKDAEKTARLQAGGWLVARFSEIAIGMEPDVVAAETRNLLGLGDRTDV